MKYLVPVNDNNLDSIVHDRFARSNLFLIYEDSEWNVIENPAVNASSGAGAMVASLIVKENVNCVIAKKVGPKAMNALNTEGVTVFEAVDATAKENINLAMNSKLKRL